MSAVGDLGRRVSERRLQLGLDSEAVAERAGMDSAYVRNLEVSPSPQPSRAALWRLAAALEMSVDDLTGSGQEAPAGRRGPTSRPVLETITTDECRVLVAPGGVGRVVFTDATGPVALPVNFRMLDGDVVFRTEATATVLSSLGSGPIAFEVDHLDEALTEGWSVLLRGEAREIDDPGEREEALSAGITPWAAGDRDALVRIEVRRWSGRRIRVRTTGA